MNPFHFPDQIKGFSRVEYLSVFVALLYAFAIAEFLLGWGKMIRQREYLKFNTQHVIWTVVFFWGLILNWYIMWPRLFYLDEGFFYFILILVPFMLAYLSTIFLFPDLDKVHDLDVYYSRNQGLIILLFTSTLLLNTVIGILLQEIDSHSPLNYIRIIVSLVGIGSVILNIKTIQNILCYMLLASLTLATLLISFM